MQAAPVGILNVLAHGGYLTSNVTNQAVDEDMRTSKIDLNGSV